MARFPRQFLEPCSNRTVVCNACVATRRRFIGEAARLVLADVRLISNHLSGDVSAQV